MKKWVIIMALLVFPASVWADRVTCTVDSDCPDGQVCLAQTCPACLPDQDCPPCGGICGVKGVGAAQTCKTDADCPTQFSCVEVDIPCPTPACVPCACACAADDADCDCDCEPCDASSGSCTPSTVHECEYTPKDCKTDADCGAGFACQEQQVCTGQGCACPSCMPDEECPACDCPDATEPVCEVTGHQCELIPKDCKTDADCDDGFECVTTQVPCNCPGCACRSGSDACQCDCDCKSGTTSVCMPKTWVEAGYNAANMPQESNNSSGSTNGINTGDDAYSNRSSDADTQASQAAATGDSGGSGCNAGSAPSSGLGLLLLLLMVIAIPRLIRAHR